MSRLDRARPLELAASDEIIAVDRLDVLRANGFDVSFTEDAPIGQRLHLVSQPQSKSTVFDMKGAPVFQHHCMRSCILRPPH